MESGETAYDVAMSVYRENVNKSGKDWKETQKCRSLASNTKEVADYLVNVATAKLTEAILQGTTHSKDASCHGRWLVIDRGKYCASSWHLSPNP